MPGVGHGAETRRTDATRMATKEYQAMTLTKRNLKRALIVVGASVVATLYVMAACLGSVGLI
jgi:hypothetical protein